MLDKFGVSTADLAEIKPASVAGRILLLDGDGPCYAVTAKCAKIQTAFNRMERHVLERMFLTGSESARVHLTPKHSQKNKRDYLIPEKFYQGNRLNKEKPELLEFLRENLADHFQDHPQIVFIANTVYEADDVLMQDCYQFPNTILDSADKDLNIAPTTRYDVETGKFLQIKDRFGYVQEKYTPSGNLKPSGHGTAFFWAQMLMGDQADHVKGITKYNGKLCGISASLKIIGSCNSEDHAANVVLDGYRALNQNPLPEAECLWLTRAPLDTAYYYISSLGLSEVNRKYLEECATRKYIMNQEEYNEWQEILAGCTTVSQVDARWQLWKKHIGL